MKCILFGHDPEIIAGAGQYKGCEFLVCKDCGNTVPLTTEDSARIRQAEQTTGVAIERPTSH